MKEKIIDLGMHPYADTFISTDQLNITEPVYPLQCELDTQTGHVMLRYKTDPSDRYNLYDYSYTSANSKFSRDHWDKYAKHTKKRLDLKNANVLEIGSNDGYLSSQYKSFGFEVLGVDPSRYMADIAKDRGIETHCDIFNNETSKKIKEKYGTFDLIVANNVFNHANDPINFAKGVKRLLDNNGTFIFEVPYWYYTIVDERFDQIYHEHVSYFTIKSSCELLKKAGLTVFDVEIVDYHGGSIRIYSSENPNQINTKIYDYIDREEEAGLFNKEMYIDFMKKIKAKRAKFLEKLYSISKKGIPIVAVGAAAKGNTFLNFYNIDSTVIDYVTDASQHKIGKYTPLTRIQIKDDESVFGSYESVYAIILSWNISSILKEKLKKINDNIFFLDLLN